MTLICSRWVRIPMVLNNKTCTTFRKDEDTGGEVLWHCDGPFNIQSHNASTKSPDMQHSLRIPHE